jgi:hypothetical protein
MADPTATAQHAGQFAPTNTGDPLIRKSRAHACQASQFCEPDGYNGRDRA